MTSTYLINIDDLKNKMPHVQGGYFLPFNISHLNDMDGLDQYKNSRMGKEGFLRQVYAQSQMGTAITAFVYGVPVAVFGCGERWPGVAEMWSILSETSKGYPIALIRGARAYIDICWISMHLHRLQITVKTSDAVAIRFAKALGFTSECNMEKYSTDQEDYTLFRRI
jgi:hypothetical protein